MSINFRQITLPDNTAAYIPDDIELVIPVSSNLPKELAHFLAYIPWDDKYLEYVPKEYKDFFGMALPYLHARTTDVHTAICLPLLKKLLQNTKQGLNERIIYITLILHDSGWSQLSDKEIADSLSYSGLALSSAAKAPKNKHAELGSVLSQKLLEEYRFIPTLSDQEKQSVHQMVLYHDVTKDVIDRGVVTPELYLIADADRLWSYTHQNFWQDTIRKGVAPSEYEKNLADELDGYFYTPQGKDLAHELLAERKDEVSHYPA